MWFWIIFAAVVVGLVAVQWLLAPLSLRGRSRRSSPTTDLMVVEAQATSTRNQTSGPSI